MKRIVLISCVSKKRTQPAPAKDLYVSPLFRLNMRYAERLQPDATFILSAKHGLLDLNTEIEPYDTTLNRMPNRQVQDWARDVLEQLESVTKPREDHFILLAGEKYRKFLVDRLPSHEVPMRGLSIGRQLQYLTRQVRSQ